jgi:hypothetical protein
MYQSYKPLRNRLSKINVTNGLLAIWHYYAYISSKIPLPAPLTPRAFRHGDPLPIQQWQLLLLSREVLINASTDAKASFTWSTIANSLNEIKVIQESISKSRYTEENGPDLAWWDVHALAHQQIPLQRLQNVQRMIRFSNIFGTDALDKLLQAKVGLTFMECVLLTFICVGNFERRGHLWKNQMYNEFGISKEKVQNFYSWLSKSPYELREELIKHRSYDQNWSYTWNALEGTPLVTVGTDERPAVICPIPSLIWNSMGSAIFFDLVNQRGFSGVYGRAFENHVGSFAHAVLTGPYFQIKGESIYKVGKDAKHGLDWYITDGCANLLVECKTKRIKVAAKTFDRQALLDELDVLATAVVQLYKNALDLVNGKTNISSNQKKCYLVVVTLEDWYLISMKATEELRGMVLAKLAENSIDPVIVNEMPYAITSCDEFERMICAIRMLGIEPVLGSKSSEEFVYWPMDGFLMKYAKEIQLSFKETYGPPWSDLIRRMTETWNPEYRDKLTFDFELV